MSIHEEVKKLTDILIEDILPTRIYLFGSFAKGTNTEESDIDLYIVMSDTFMNDKYSIAQKAYRAIRRKSKRPVDIVVGCENDFSKSLLEAPLEAEIKNTGVIVYEK